MPQGTLREIAIHNGNDKAVGIIDAVSVENPELTVVPGRTIKGTTFKYPLKLKNPRGSFRRINEGASVSDGEYIERRAEAYVFDSPISVDKRAAQAHEDGEAAYMAIRAVDTTKGSFEALGEQFYEGKGDDNEIGFPGLKAIVAGAVADGFDVRVDAGGSTANAGTSIYLVRLGEDGVQFIWGQGVGFEVGEFVETPLTDTQGRRYSGYFADAGGWVGLVSYHPKAVVRGLNLTAQAGKSLTDAFASKMFGKLPIGFKQDKSKLRWLVPTGQMELLQQSRTAINTQTYKAGAVADYPEEILGIAIVETNSIHENDAIEA